jgi:hypothetical protein
MIKLTLQIRTSEEPGQVQEVDFDISNVRGIPEAARDWVLQCLAGPIPEESPELTGVLISAFNEKFRVNTVRVIREYTNWPLATIMTALNKLSQGDAVFIHHSHPKKFAHALRNVDVIAHAQ